MSSICVFLIQNVGYPCFASGVARDTESVWAELGSRGPDPTPGPPVLGLREVVPGLSGERPFEVQAVRSLRGISVCEDGAKTAVLKIARPLMCREKRVLDVGSQAKSAAAEHSCTLLCSLPPEVQQLVDFPSTRCAPPTDGAVCPR